MNKKQLFEAMWIPIEKRMPPNDQVNILCWHGAMNVPVILQGYVLHNGMKNGKEHYFVTKWMRIYGGQCEGDKLSDKEMGVRK